MKDLGEGAVGQGWVALGTRRSSGEQKLGTNHPQEGGALRASCQCEPGSTVSSI